MRLIVTGSNGQLGKSILRANTKATIHGIQRPEVDIRDEKAVRKTIESFRPDVIIHAAALTNVEYCEDHEEEAREINVAGTENIVRAAGGAHIVYLSTEYVFDGTAGPYSEEDVPRPQSVYAKTKYQGEVAVRAAKDSAVVRTTVVYTYEEGSKNFLMQTLSGRLDRFPTDQVSNPTLTENLAEATLEIARKKIRGTYNIVGADRVDRHRFALAIAEKFGLDSSTWKPVSTADLRQRAPRPLDCGLVIDKARRDLETRLFTLEEALDFAWRKSGRE